MPSKPVPPVAVLGAGIAGLVAARDLKRAGIPVVVFEAGIRCCRHGRESQGSRRLLVRHWRALHHQPPRD